MFSVLWISRKIKFEVKFESSLYFTRPNICRGVKAATSIMILEVVVKKVALYIATTNNS